MDSDLLTASEAAELLRLKVSTIRAWVLRRRIPFHKMGGRVLFHRKELEIFIAKCLVPAVPESPAGTNQGGQ